MSGGGGGIIIIRNAIKQALSDPLVHGNLPPGIQTDIASALAKDTSAWSIDDDKATQHAFSWAMRHC
jgi:hypothetical protein